MGVKYKPPAFSASDAILLAKLRQLVDQGGHDGFSPDPLHIAAADRIEDLLSRLYASEAHQQKLLQIIANLQSEIRNNGSE